MCNECIVPSKQRLNIINLVQIMGTRRYRDDCDDQPTKKSVFYRISKPFRCLAGAITFPLGCLLFTVIYWFIFIPILYYLLEAACPKHNNRCTWSGWQFLFWTIASLIWVIIISVAICYWSCSAGREHEQELQQRQVKIEEERKERDKLLSDQVKYNSKHQNLTNLTIINEKQSPPNDVDRKHGFNTIQEENIIERTTVTLPIRKSIVFNEENTTVVDNKLKNADVHKHDTTIVKVPKTDRPDESMMEEIDKMFPRCSVRRKPEPKKRPDTLIIHSPKYPKEEHEVKRFTVQERPATASPLTPREIFFKDLIQGAKRQTIERTENFLDNERKHSSNNYVNSNKPEVKDYILKQRSANSASSPEYFIANVPDRKSCTTEVFLFVDGGQPQEALTICYIDQDDDVFKS